MAATAEIEVCRLDELADPDSREFQIGDGDWPFRGFIVRQGDGVFAFRNFCMHVGHPLNWMPHGFLTKERDAIICSSHGAQYEMDTGLCFAGPCIGKSLHKVDCDIRNGVIYVTGPTSMVPGN